MSKIKIKKLNLNKETIAKLQASQILEIKGGRAASYPKSCHRRTCGTNHTQIQ